MFCKAYCAFLVICVTCLIIMFYKFNNDQRIVFFQYQYSLRNNGTSLLSSSSLFIDTKLPSQQVRLLETEVAGQNRVNYSAGSKPEFQGTKFRMENNNSKKENGMDSAETNLKDLSPSPTEDTIDFHVDHAGNFSGQFNITELNDHLKKCIRESDKEVDMDEYIKTFQQLYKFFCMLGTLFGFIGSDVRHKIEILQDYRAGDNRTHYETVEKMIMFEKSTDYIHSNKASSGSRTFLRLHRSLIFVSKFLGKVDDIEDDDGISRICKDAYAQTLAKFHPWIIQKGAGIAMLGLPTKKDLIGKVCANGIVDCNDVASIMHEVIRLTADIYEQCERLYTENDLHGLP